MLEPNANTTSKSPSPPAYFLSLTVENFRCFKQSSTLDLSDGNGKPSMWNVILGENGVGKTTLLQSLAALQPIQTTFDDQYFPMILINASPETYGMWMNSFRSPSSVEARVYLDQQRVAHSIRVYRPDESGTKFFPISPILAQLICFGYGANRRSGTTHLIGREAKNEIATLFDISANLVNAEEWLLQANYAAQNSSKQNYQRTEKRLAQVIDLVCGILPEGGVTDIRFGLNEDTAVMTPRVEAETPFGWVRLRDLSLGYQAALTWMVDLAARMLERYPDSPNPLAEPAIVLVDEIDLHLHPKWQRELITKLRTTFPKTQFIVTAHSPLIVQAAPDANIALLKRVGDHVEIENDVDRVRDWRVDQILTSDVFGLDSSYPEHIQRKLEERSKIATKARLSAADREKLAVLDAEIDALPVGETSEDRKALDALRRANAYFESARK